MFFFLVLQFLSCANKSTAHRAKIKDKYSFFMKQIYLLCILCLSPIKKSVLLKMVQ